MVIEFEDIIIKILKGCNFFEYRIFFLAIRSVV